MDKNQKWPQAALFIVPSSVQKNHIPTLFLLFLLLFLHLALFHITQFGFSNASSITDGLQQAGTAVRWLNHLGGGTRHRAYTQRQNHWDL